MSQLLTESEVAKMMGLSVHWLRRMRQVGGGIPFIKLTEGRGAIRYRGEDVEAFCAARVQKSTSDQRKAA